MIHKNKIRIKMSPQTYFFTGCQDRKFEMVDGEKRKRKRT